MSMDKNKNQKCHVPHCRKIPNCSLHTLPADTDRRRIVRQQWIVALDIDPTITDALIFICSLHFTEDDFTSTGKRARLKQNAVPSRYLPKQGINSSLKNASECEYGWTTFTVEVLADDVDEVGEDKK